MVGLTLSARLVLAATLHLTEDEAYYRLWSMAPAFGYYDHPPMISWWVWMGMRLLGDSPLGVRLMPILASGLTTLLICDITRILGGDRRDVLRAAVWYNAMFLVVGGAILAVPDAPATLFWTATVWCAIRAVRDGSIRWWLAVGAAAGFASLSKYSALFLAPGVLAWLAMRSSTRSRLASPGPWIAVMVAMVLFSVNVSWNAEHHWLTFEKQFGRIAPSHFAPIHLVAFLAAQCALINPLIAVFLYRAVSQPESRRKVESLLVISAPFFFYLIVHSLHDSVQAHWPAPIYPSLAVCAALAGRNGEDEGRWARLGRIAPFLGIAAYGLALVALVAPGKIWARFASPIVGWHTFSGRLEQARESGGAAWVGVMSYGLLAELYDEPTIKAPILQLTERDRYQGLKLPVPDLERPGLVVDLARRVNENMLRACFAKVTYVSTVRRVDPSPPAKAYSVYLVAGPRRDLIQNGCLDGH